jgi:hypothetical protein|tara:strand:+ start:87 stop:242 length:156 start_codon:yes stop_codon:yes gene_type:complete
LEDEFRFSSELAASLAVMLLELNAELQEFCFQMDLESSSAEAVPVHLEGVS